MFMTPFDIREKNDFTSMFSFYCEASTKGKADAMVPCQSSQGPGASVVDHWLGCRAPNAGALGSIPSQETRSACHN